MTPIPRPSRGQVVWWVIGGVVAVAAFASAAVAAGHGDSASGTEGAGPADPRLVAASIVASDVSSDVTAQGELLAA